MCKHMALELPSKGYERHYSKMYLFAKHTYLLKVLIPKLGLNVPTVTQSVK